MLLSLVLDMTSNVRVALKNFEVASPFLSFSTFALNLKHKTKMRVDLRITCLLVLVFNSELMFDVVCNGVIDIYVAQLFVEDFQCQFSGQLL